MRRVVVLGNGGSGKSVLATAIAGRVGLPVTHLDVQESSDIDGLRWVLTYRARERPPVLALPAQLADDVDVHRLRSPR